MNRTALVSLCAASILVLASCGASEEAAAPVTDQAVVQTAATTQDPASELGDGVKAEAQVAKAEIVETAAAKKPQAASKSKDAGIDIKGRYELVKTAPISRDDGKVEVVEFFWYGCPHCYSFEPALEPWKEKLGDNVVFRREAPALNRSWEPQSRAFYAAELMGVTNKLHTPLFNAIHKEKRDLRSIESIAKFAAELGIDSDKFLSTAKSFAVDARLSQAARLAMNYELSGVPTVVVQGKYRTSGSLSGAPNQWLQVVDELINTESK